MDDHHSAVPGDLFSDRVGSATDNLEDAGEKEKTCLEDPLDIIAMVRSLQRTAGQADCFRRGNADCDSIDCDWRTYCLGGAAEPNAAKRRQKKKP